MKNFVKALAKHRSNGFECLSKKFPKLSQANLKKEIFVNPQSRKVFEDPEFEKALNALALRDLLKFSEKFQVTFISRRCAGLLVTYKEMGCRIFLKMHFLYLHLEFFPENQLVNSRMKDFTKIYKQWKKGIKEFGMRV